MEIFPSAPTKFCYRDGMGIDAVLLLRVKSKSLLRAKLAAAGLPESNLRPLQDGCALLSTFARFGTPGKNELQLREVLTQLFGASLSELHDDERGVFAFGDSMEPEAQSYHQVVLEVGAAGVWLPLEPLAQTLEWAPTADEAEAPVASEPIDLSALLRGAGFASFEEMLAGAAGRAADPELALGALIISRTTPLPDALPDTNSVHRLADGTHVIVTTRFLPDWETLAMSLGEEWASWLSEHQDARGVRLFPFTSLDAVLAGNTYERAIEATGPSARWVQPQTLQDIQREAEERAQRFFDES
jgi:hypothetical protein